MESVSRVYATREGGSLSLYVSLSKNWQKISALSSLSESLSIFRPIICLSTETPNRSIGSVLTSVTKGGRYGNAENLNFLER